MRSSSRNTMIVLLICAAFLAAPTVLADDGDVHTLIWKGKLDWISSPFTGKNNLRNDVNLSRGSLSQQTENTFEADPDYNMELPTIEKANVKYEFAEIDVIKLSVQQDHSVALQLVFIGEGPNAIEYLSIVVPVSGITDDQTSINTKLEDSLRNLGREFAPGNIYTDSLQWLESMLEGKFVAMEDISLVNTSVRLYDNVFMSNVQYVSNDVLTPFFRY